MNFLNAPRFAPPALVLWCLTCAHSAPADTLRLKPTPDAWFLVHPSGQDHVRLSPAAPRFDCGAFQIGGTNAGKGTWCADEVDGELRWTGEWTVTEPRPADIRAVLRLKPKENLLRKTAELRLKSGPPALLRSVLIDDLARKSLT